MTNASSYLAAAVFGAAAGAIAAGALGKKDNQQLAIGAGIGLALALATVAVADGAGNLQDPTSASVLKGIKELRSAVSDEDDAGRQAALKRIGVSLNKIDPTVDV